MTGSGYAYVLAGDSLHVLLNEDKIVENEFLYNGLSFIVEEGID